MAKSKKDISMDVMERAATIMKAIAHPVRLRLLEILERDKEANVTALCQATGASQPVVSQQLARMRREGVLGTRREGTSVYYHVARPEVLGMLGCIRRMSIDTK